MVLMAGFAALLHRYSRQDDLLVGTPVAGRTRHEFEPLIGFFVNTVLIRSQLDDTLTMRGLLGSVRASALAAQTHQAVPFDRVSDLVAADRTRDRTPLPQVMLALQSATPEVTGFGGLHASLFWVHNGTSKYDLFLNVEDDSAGLRLGLEYDADLFDAGTADRLLDSYEVVLASVAHQPDQRVRDIPVLSRSDADLLDRVNNTAAPEPAETTVHAMFERQAATTPDRVAVVCGTEEWTYAALDRRASQIAMTVRARGITPDSLVGICLERSMDMVAAVLGVMKAGGAYVPLDPSYPADRLAAILADSKAALILTSATLRATLPASSAEVVCLDGDQTVSPASDVETRILPVTERNLAYVLFTSGSTGRPKGVAIEHRAIATFIAWAHAVFSPSQLAGVLFGTSICFDLSAFELFVPLTAGGTVIVAGTALDLPTMPARNRVTLVNTVPSVMAELLRGPGMPASVSTINLAGEPLPESLVEAIGRSAPQATVYNLYGPTETTTYSTFTRVAPGEKVTIGAPIAFTRVYVLDGHGHRVPPGVPGELFIGGRGVARGYYGRPDLTSERFVADPFVADQGARMYRTGDLCRWRADGVLEYLGRLDHQVKIRGLRIELGEIEAVLARHPGVEQAVVVARAFETGDQRLVAYVTARDGQGPSPDVLRAQAAAALPAYMVPATFVLLDRMPLTPNGKVDRKALPDPSSSPTENDRPSTEPMTPTEIALAGIWRDLLRVPRIGTDENFFHIGGHSLMAIRLFARIRESFGVELPFGLLLQQPTIGELAKTLDRHATPEGAPDARSALISLRATGHRPPLFFTHGVGGEVWTFRAVTEHLGDDQPVYGLQPVAHEQGALTVETVAAKYIDEILSVAPNGPYLLAGHCAGAALAFEMARQLRAAGKDVGLVAAIDYWFFDTSDRRPSARAAAFIENLPRWVADDLSQVSPATILGRIRSKVRLAWARISRLSSPADTGPVDIRDQLGMWRFPDYQVAALAQTFAMFQAYRPGTYDGDLLVIRARTLPLFPVKQAAPDMGWSRVVHGHLTMKLVRGSHETLLQEPLVAGVAAVIRTAIDDVISRQRRHRDPGDTPDVTP
jgi:amino acid adenylation domain-containing protein